MRPGNLDTRFRVYRGGAWNLDYLRWCRPGYRDRDNPIITDIHLGFRVFRRVREVRR